jgi:hypothetical protein
MFNMHGGSCHASKSNVRGYGAAGLEASLHSLLTTARLTRVLTHRTCENTTVAISKCGSKVGLFVSGADMSLEVEMATS